MKSIMESGMQRNRNITYAVLTAGMQRLLQLLGSVIIIPLLLHSLGTTYFGIWGAATSLAWLSGILDIGLGAVVISLVAEGMATDRLQRIRDQMAVVIIGASLMGLLVISVGTLCVCLWIKGVESAAFLIAVVAIGINIPLSMATSAWLGLQKGYISGMWDSVQVILNITALLIAVALHAHVLIMVALFYGSIVITNILCSIHLLWSCPQLYPVQWRVSVGIWRQIGGKSLLFALISIVLNISFGLDNVLALMLLGPEASARMAIIMRLGINAIGIVAVLTQPLWPAFIEARGKEEHRWVWKALVKGTMAVIGLCILGGGILGLFGQKILHWWLGGALDINTTLLWATALWILGLSLPRVAWLLLNAASDLKFQLALCIPVCVIAIAAKLLFVAEFGILGIWLATPLCLLIIMCPAYTWRIYSVLYNPTRKV